MLNLSKNKNNLRSATKTFNDGQCSIYKANERVLESSKGLFRFCNESVGLNQFWQGYINNIGVDRSISIPLSNASISVQDVVFIGTDIYTINRIQYHDNAKPHYLTLSLSKARFSYQQPLSL